MNGICQFYFPLCAPGSCRDVDQESRRLSRVGPSLSVTSDGRSRKSPGYKSTTSSTPSRRQTLANAGTVRSKDIRVNISRFIYLFYCLFVCLFVRSFVCLFIYLKSGIRSIRQEHITQRHRRQHLFYLIKFFAQHISH